MHGSDNSAEPITKEQLEHFEAQMMARFDDHLHQIIQQLANPLQGNHVSGDNQNLQLPEDLPFQECLMEQCHHLQLQ